MGGSPPPHAGVRGRSPRETVVPIYEKKKYARQDYTTKTVCKPCIQPKTACRQGYCEDYLLRSRSLSGSSGTLKGYLHRNRGLKRKLGT